MTRPYTDDAIRLLGGAVRIRTRVRGFALWSPHGATLQLLEQVRAVLVEYEDHLPLTIRQIFYRLVGAYNYEKTERAYARLCEHLPDLILMDIQLPIMDGYTAVSRIKADPALRSIPIIAVTSYALNGEEKKARAAGCDDYVPKPFSPRQLLAKIKQYLS